MTVDWQDRDKRLLQCIDELKVTIHPMDSKEIVYAYDSILLRKEFEEELTQLDINGLDYKNDFRDWNPKEFDAKIANKWGFTTSTPFMHYYRIPLKGEKRYDVHRSTTRTIPIDAEPFTNIDSKHIIRKASVKVHCIPDDIKVELISAGTLEEFEPIGPSNPHTARQNDLDMVYPGLILPHQGYISVFTKVSLESSGVSDG